MKDNQLSTLGEALPAQIEKCTRIMADAASIGPTGRFLVAMIQADIAAANKAMMEGDLPGMIQAHSSLEAYKH